MIQLIYYNSTKVDHDHDATDDWSLTPSLLLNERTNKTIGMDTNL